MGREERIVEPLAGTRTARRHSSPHLTVLKGDTDRAPDGASGPYVMRPVPIEEARGECELSFPAKAVSSWGSREP